MDAEENRFGACANYGEWGAVCSKGMSLEFMARMKRDLGEEWGKMISPPDEAIRTLR